MHNYFESLPAESRPSLARLVPEPRERETQFSISGRISSFFCMVIAQLEDHLPAIER
jgi:hypothetical protein